MMSTQKSLMSESSDSEIELKINKCYADKYDTWRNKEEMQKLKDLSKDISDTSSESEEEEEPKIEEDFLATLSLLKSKDPKIYNQNITFFKEQITKKKTNLKKDKPMFIKDYERKLVLERDGKLSDDDEEHIFTKGPTLQEEQEETKQDFKVAAGDSDTDDDLLQVKEKTKKEQDDEEADYIGWMKGKKENISTVTKQNMSFLHTFWNDPKLDDSEKFLRDYILNEKYLEKDNSNNIPSYEDITQLSDDEKVINQQEEFENKFNFRFEEPDQEFIKRYPRTIGDSMRHADSKRKVQREAHAENKRKEKEIKKEELKRLKALKRKEIEEKFSKIREITGTENINFDESDMEGDFDPEKHDQKMKEMFNDDFYSLEEEQKPTFEYDEDLDEENWDHWTKEEKSDIFEKPQSNSESLCNIFGQNEAQSKFEQEMIESTQFRKRKSKKKSLFAKAVSQEKPVFDADGKSFEEYLDEYYKMDYEDLIGDMPVRFKYRKVIPNDFGLTTNEILTAHDKELNRWCSVKKTCQYRKDDEELYDVQAFSKKAQNPLAKQRILSSIYSHETLETETKTDSETISKKKRKRKKKNNNTLDEVGKLSDEIDNFVNKEMPCLDNTIDSNHVQNTTTQSIPCYNSDNTKKKEKKKNRKKRNSKQDILDQSCENSIIRENPKDLGNEFKPDTKSQKSKKQKVQLNGFESDLQLVNDASFDIKHDTYNQPGYLPLEGKLIPQKRCKVYIEEEVSSSAQVKRKRHLLDKTVHHIPHTESSNSKNKKLKKRASVDNTFTNSNTVKNLDLTDERLSAYGINPKKFKNKIKYAKYSSNF